MFQKVAIEVFYIIVVTSLLYLLTLNGRGEYNEHLPSGMIIYALFVISIWRSAENLQLSRVAVVVSFIASVIYVSDYVRMSGCVHEGRLSRLEFYIKNLSSTRWSLDLPEETINAFRAGEIFLHFDLESYESTLPAELEGASNIIIHRNPLNEDVRIADDNWIHKQCLYSTIGYSLASYLQ